MDRKPRIMIDSPNGGLRDAKSTVLADLAKWPMAEAPAAERDISEDDTLTRIPVLKLDLEL